MSKINKRTGQILGNTLVVRFLYTKNKTIMYRKSRNTVPHVIGIRKPHPPDPLQLGVSYPMRPWLRKLWEGDNYVSEIRK